MAESTEHLRQKWEHRVLHARKIREDWERRFLVRQLAEAFLGCPEVADGSALPIYLNHFYATIQTQRPTLLPKEIKFVAQTATKSRAILTALEKSVAEGLLNTLAAQDDNLINAARLAVTQCFWRCGVLKVVYDQRFERNPRAGDEVVDAYGMALRDEDGAPETEPRDVLEDEVYQWAWVDAACMLFPDEGPDVSRWSWIGEEVRVTLEDARADPRFPRSLRRRLKVNSSVHQRYGHLQEVEYQADELDGSTVDGETGRVCYYECYDLRQMRYYIWAPGQDFDEYLVDEDTPDGIEDHPYALLLPVPVIEPRPLPWPMPLTYNWLPLQNEYNAIRQLQLNAAKTAARKVLYDQTTFPDEDEARKVLQSNVDMEAAMVNDLARPPLLFGDSVQSPDVSRNIPFLLNDWQRITGATGTRLGDPDADTATEAIMTEQAAGVRDADLSALVQRWLGTSGKKMLQLVRQTLTLDLLIEIRGMGEEQWLEFIGSPALRGWLSLRLGAERVPSFLHMLALNPQMQEQMKERFSAVQPFRVTRSQLGMQADLTVMPSTIKPIQRAQLMQVAQMLGPLALMSPTLVESFLLSFDLPNAEQIAEEILANVQKMGGPQALLGKQQGAGGPGGEGTTSPIARNGMQPFVSANTGGV